MRAKSGRCENMVGQRHTRINLKRSGILAESAFSDVIARPSSVSSCFILSPAWWLKITSEAWFADNTENGPRCSCFFFCSLHWTGWRSLSWIWAFYHWPMSFALVHQCDAYVIVCPKFACVLLRFFTWTWLWKITRLLQCDCSWCGYYLISWPH